MVPRLELDIRDLESAAVGSGVLSGLDVLGNGEDMLGSSHHEYRIVETGFYIHTQDFAVTHRYQYRLARRNYLTFQFRLRGRLQYLIGGHRFASGHGSLRITADPLSSTDVKPTGDRLVGLGMFVDKALLTDKFGLQIDLIPEHIRPMFLPTVHTRQTLELPMCAASRMAVEDMAACRFVGPLRTAYLNAKAMELICLAVSRLNDRFQPHTLFGSRGGDRLSEALEMAALIYRRNISAPPSIDALARRVGLNRTSLTDGFRERFRETPASFSRRVRLEWASQQLEDGRRSVAETAAACGYTSQAAFSRAYGEHFGAPPSSRLRRNAYRI
ncbi:helix-turn-helix domain-containing protein [Bosea sp. AAP35]|uniref:AraC family transcriptional regulator n=1 Tax=Bosea sp. AAP35 TaxID=1523417 RepID=UPI000A666564|nr:helix-turn-helix domain-containing protein [Bosea sp. AAP35]